MNGLAPTGHLTPTLERHSAERCAPGTPPVETPTRGTTRILGKDEEVFAEGDRAAFFYKVLSGAVRTFKLLDDGRRQIDAFHLPGDIFGIEPGEEHRFSAEAVGTAAVIAYRRSALDTDAPGDGLLGRQLLAATLRSLARAQDHMLLLGRKNALERIATFLLDLCGRLSGQESAPPRKPGPCAIRATEAGSLEVDLPMSRIDIADHLGLTIETVSRSLTQLERQGVIHLGDDRRSLRLRDKGALRRLAA